MADKKTCFPRTDPSFIQLAAKLFWYNVAEWGLMRRSIRHSIFADLIFLSPTGNKYLLFSPFFFPPTFIIQSFLHQEVYYRHTLILVSLLSFELLSKYSRKMSLSLFIHFIQQIPTEFPLCPRHSLHTSSSFVLCVSQKIALIMAEYNSRLSNIEASLFPDERFWKTIPN